MHRGPIRPTPFDWAEGKNNMNEEWFGITALGTPNGDGVYDGETANGL